MLNPRLGTKVSVLKVLHWSSPSPSSPALSQYWIEMLSPCCAYKTSLNQQTFQILKSTSEVHAGPWVKRLRKSCFLRWIQTHGQTHIHQCRTSDWAPPLADHANTPVKTAWQHQHQRRQVSAVMLTRTFHQGPGLGLGCQAPGLHSQGLGPWFEYKDKDKDLSKCGHISVNIPGI